MTETDRARQEPPSMADAAEMLWVVLASVSGGDWTKQSVEWQEAAARWRDYYFAALTASSVPPVREAATPAEPSLNPEPHVEALVDRAGAWQAEVFDAEVSGRRLTRFEDEARQIMGDLMLALAHSVPGEAAALPPAEEPQP